METNEWELSKENIQPLQKGRKPVILKAALTLHAEDPILLQRQAFEEELRVYSGDDPLSVWCKYIWWAEQSFPKGGKDGQIQQLYQKCIDMLKNETKYYDDTRFVEIWLKYANVFSRAVEVYNCMYTHNIGCKFANFFVAWSWELERQGNVKKAYQVVEEGLKRRAEPYERLQSYRSELEQRVANSVAKTCSQSDEQGENLRSAFSVLKPERRNLAPVMRTGDAIVDPSRISLGQQPMPKRDQPLGKVPFKVYTSENLPSLPLQSENALPYQIHSDISKENERKPSKWNKAKLKNSCSNPIVDKPPAFEFHQDACTQGDASKLTTPRSIPKVSNILRQRQQCPSPALALFEPPDPKFRPMYDKSKVYCGAEEFSFEEIRAAEWLKNYKEEEQARKMEKQQQLLSEQQKLLSEQREKEEEMKRQIQALMQEVQILKTSRLSSVPANSSTDMDIKCNDSTHNKYNKEWNGMNSLYTSSESINQNHISDFSQGRGLGSTSYNEAANIIQDLYNHTLFNPTEVVNVDMVDNKGLVDTAVSSMLNELQVTDKLIQSNSLPVKNAFIPFSFYRDPTESIQVKKVMDENFEQENQENVPPAGYEQASEKRELNGILEPSKNVEWAPLEEEEEEEEIDADDELDPDENYIYKKVYPSQNETLIPPCNTEQFVSALPLASTPCNQARHKKVFISDKNYHPPVQQTSAETMNHYQISKPDKVRESIVGQPASHLSIIMETSKECYKSSSSSGSSASVTKLSHYFSHDKSNINRHLSKYDGFKEPRSVASSNALSSTKISKATWDFHNDIPMQLSVTDTDPFESSQNEKFLKILNIPSDHFGKVQVVNQAMKALKVNDTIEVASFTYCIENLVAEGAYGKVYEAEKKLSFCDNFDMNDLHSKVALKACKNANDWELYICNETHRRLGELKLRPDIRPSVMEVISAKRFNNGIVLVNEFSSQGTLLDLRNYYKKQGNTVPELISMYLTWELLQIMSKIHACKIIHADIKPDNVLLRDNMPSASQVLDSLGQKTSVLKLIDFGRAVDLTFYKPGTCFTAVLKESCIEMKENKPWAFQLDWFGIMDCVHTLLFSDYLKVKQDENGRWVLEKKLKRYWDQSIWEPLFDQYLNIESCYKEPDVNEHLKRLEEKIKANAASFKVHFQRIQTLF